MKITRLKIKNFRSIKELDLELGDTTVFIGPNNCGKTAILEAIRIALTRRWGQRGTGFTEYDVHMASETSDPKSSPGIEIEIRVEERRAGEWSEALVQDLDDIVQTDPATGLNSITLLSKCAWSAGEKCFEPSWTFLNAANAPLVGASARGINLQRFWQYLPVFYLGALRDAADEFSSRSQFWGRLLKEMEIPEALEAKTQKVLDLLNKKLLRADPRLAEVAETLSGVTRIAASDREGGVDLRLVPLKAWDILSKAQIILRNETDRPWLPLQHHGQGIQSLSVIFLFHAFVEHLLAELYEADSTAVLALEEPETHLHPQAARTLWRHVNALPGQKVITTHSPYFVQNVPFRDLRLVRLGANGTEIRFLAANFLAKVPHVAALDAAVVASAGLLEYERASQELTVNGKLTTPVYRQLLACYTTPEGRNSVHPILRKLYDESTLFVSDTELRALETYARRIRGEIFFARKWMLVEGQSEYLIVQALSQALGYSFDEHGIALIDAANNGDPATFTVLARALGIPWCAVFDGDPEGGRYVRSIEGRDFDPALVAQRCATLPARDLEDQLVADGLTDDLKQILEELGVAGAAQLAPPQLQEALRNHKTGYAAKLALRLQVNAALAQRMPQAFRNAIALLRTLT
jgi:putative ATP-dependent endonuclease of the OLD family